MNDTSAVLESLRIQECSTQDEIQRLTDRIFAVTPAGSSGHVTFIPVSVVAEQPSTSFTVLVWSVGCVATAGCMLDRISANAGPFTLGFLNRTMPPACGLNVDPVSPFFVFGEAVVKARQREPVETVYQNENHIRAVLGPKGQGVLYRVLQAIRSISLEMNWPLTRIVTSPMKDNEVKDWEYVLVVLSFSGYFEDADAYLHLLYPKLDTMVAQLGAEDRELYARLIYFDVTAQAYVR